MAQPLSATAALDALKREGLKVVEYKSTWKTHNRGQRGDGWGPMQGVMLHHTATSGATAARVKTSVELCWDGYTGLPGPLCHGVIAPDGTVYLVGWGRANHAGLGDDDVLRAVINETPIPADDEANTDGNARFYGFEAINLGDNTDDWPPAQVEAMVRASAALLRAHDWNKDGTGFISVIGHKEWQPGKPDPSGPGLPSMNTIRSRVAERLKHPASWSPGVPGQATYTVRDGDTLGDIADRFHTTVDKLVALNKNLIKDPDEIEVGWKLKLK